MIARVMMFAVAIGLLLPPSRGLAQDPARPSAEAVHAGEAKRGPEPAYLKPSTPAVGGIHHLSLIYAGGKSRTPWDAEKPPKSSNWSCGTRMAAACL
jgi:hypothetical protein